MNIIHIWDHPFKTSANSTPTPLRRQFFSTIRRQIWQIFDPSPPKTCRRLKWMVPMHVTDHNSKFIKLEDVLPDTQENPVVKHFPLFLLVLEPFNFITFQNMYCENSLHVIYQLLKFPCER